jgi:hypothetical protein
MKPTLFAYEKSLIKRRIWINGFFILATSACLILGDSSHKHFAAIFILGGTYYSYKLIRDLILLFQSAPAITISPDGVRDAHLGNILIPWASITEIKTTTPCKSYGKRFGSMIILFAKASQLKTSPGPLAVRFANWIRGAKPGLDNELSVLPMTVTIALEDTLDDLLDAIRGHAPAPLIIREVADTANVEN